MLTRYKLLLPFSILILLALDASGIVHAQEESNSPDSEIDFSIVLNKPIINWGDNLEVYILVNNHSEENVHIKSIKQISYPEISNNVNEIILTHSEKLFQFTVTNLPPRTTNISYIIQYTIEPDIGRYDKVISTPVDVRSPFEFRLSDAIIPLIIGFGLSQGATYFRDFQDRKFKKNDQEKNAKSKIRMFCSMVKFHEDDEKISMDIWKEVLIKGSVLEFVRTKTQNNDDKYIDIMVIELIVECENYNRLIDNFGVTDNMVILQRQLLKDLSNQLLRLV